jgi:Ca2+-binding RTX toxin-like protein
MAIISGTMFNDNLYGTALASDMLYGGDGNDLLTGEWRTVKILTSLTGFSSLGGSNAAVSDNGLFVAFRSGLVAPGDTNGVADIYVADVATGQLTLASRATDGTVANGDSSGPVLAASGHFVAFTSSAANLVGAADTNALTDVFVKDLLSGAIERVSTATGGTQATGGGSGVLHPDDKGISISTDGRYVAFESRATNLVAGDSNGKMDIFLKDRATGETLRLSESSTGMQTDGDSERPMLSGDGQRVVFVSSATNLVTDDNNGVIDVFVRDVASGETFRVSTASDGGQANGTSYQTAISRDGGFVAFSSAASNLVAGDTNGMIDLFVKNLESGEIVRANTAADGTQSTGGYLEMNGSASISADGRFVVFLTGATNLVAGDTNGVADVFVKDLQTGNIARVSIAPDGIQANAGGYAPSISADGRIITWDTKATTVNPTGSGNENIVAVANPLFSMDTLAGGAGNDIYLLRTYDQVIEQAGEGMDTVRTDLARYTLSSNVENLQIIGGVGSLGQGNELANTLAGGPGVDRLEGLAGNDVLYGERGVLRMSTASGGGQANAMSTDLDLSADGRYVAFGSQASNLAGRNVNGTGSDAFVKDVATGRTILASAVGTTQTGNSASSDVSICADGRYVTFVSTADNLVGDDTNGAQDIFVRNVVGNTTTRVSTASDGTQANGWSYQPVISGAGGFVAFLSSASNLVVGDTNGVLDVFLKNLGNSGLTRVSTSSTGVQANGSCFNPGVSSDGSVVAFDSMATNLVASDTNAVTDVFVKVVNTDATALISVSTAGVQGNSDSFAPVLAANGQLVLFQSRASNLVADDTNGTDDLFLRDRVAGTTIRVSTLSDGSQANMGAAYGDISDDGRYVVFQSMSSNLVTGDVNGFVDVFVKDLLTGKTALVSIAADGTQGNGNSLTPTVSGDGRVIAFVTAASNLLAGDTNGVSDVVRVANPLAVQDTLVGGEGNDTFVVNALDTIIEAPSQGTDTIRTLLASYTLPDNVEVLQYMGGGNFVGLGNGLDNTLLGNAGADMLNGGLGNDSLNGGTGADTMIGGLGNDTYSVDNVGDVTSETSTLATEIDTVVATVNRALGANLENLTLSGISAINGTGNTLNNTLVGNTAANVLNGGSGIDTMIGGTGNDTYSVDNAGDVTSETSTLATEIDTVIASVSRTLGANLEKLLLSGTAAINGTGNTLNNTLVGNTAANVLNGGSGIDTMIGGTGNDTYSVDNAGDVTSETSTLATEIDTVIASVSRTLGANLERLVFTGTAAINGTGNTLNNTLLGNDATNILNGDAGNDLINGGLGNDTLIGGAGIDTFVFDSVLNATTNRETLTDFSVTDDTLRLDQTVFAKLTTLGGLNASFFCASTTGAAADSNDYILYNTSNGVLAYDADGNGLGTAVQFATLTAKPALTAADFVVVA